MRIQNLLERNRNRMQGDFEKWIEVMLTQRSMMTNNTNTGSIAPKNNNFMKPSNTKPANDISDTKSEISMTHSIASTATQKENVSIFIK